MSWAILVFSALMLVWLVYEVASTPSVSDADMAECNPTLTADECQEKLETDRDVGIYFLVAIFVVLWIIGFGFLSLMWFTTRPHSRVCPHCGEDVRKGLTACKSCGYDFTSGGKPPASEPTAP